MIAAIPAAVSTVDALNVHAELETAVQNDGEQEVELSQSLTTGEEPEACASNVKKTNRGLGDLRIFVLKVWSINRLSLLSHLFIA